MRTRRPWLIGAGLAGAALIGAGALVLGPLGAPFVSALADGRTLGSLGRLDMEGVRGARLGDLKIARLTLTDAEGVWLDARDLELRWRPLALLSGAVNLKSARAGDVTLARAPTLTPSRRSRVTLRAPQLTIDRLRLPAAWIAQPVDALFSVAGGVETRRGALAQLNLNAKRSDGGADALDLAFTGGGAPALQLSLDSPEGGAIAGLLGAPITARANAKDGAGRLNATIAGRDAIGATAAWRDGAVRANARFDLSAAPRLSALTARFGAVGTLVIDRPARAGSFTAELKTDRLTSSVSGRFGGNGRLDGPAAIKLDAAGAIADFDAGRVSAAGDVRQTGDSWAFSGQAQLTAARRLDLIITAAGPISARVKGGALDIETALSASRIDGPQPAARLLKDVKLALATTRAADGGWNFSRLRLTSAGLDVRADASGQSGAWTLSRAELLLDDWRGGAAGAWRLARGKTPTLTLTGAGKKLAAPSPLDQMLGSNPTLAATLAFPGERVDVVSARMEGPKLRLGGAGAIRGTMLDLNLEAAARGPVRLGDVDVAGAGTATGKLTGPLNAWRLDADAALNRLDIAGAALISPRLKLTLRPTDTGFSGPLSAHAQFAGQPVTLTGDFAADGQVLRLQRFSAGLVQARARGDARIDAKGLTVDALLNGRLDDLWPGAKGAINGAFQFAPGPDNRPTIALDAAIADAVLAEGFSAGAARLTANGPLYDVRLAATARGGLGGAGPFELSATGGGDFSGPTKIALALSGDLAGRPIATSRDAQLNWDAAGRLSLDAPLKLGDGGADLSIASDAAGWRADLKADRAPLALLAGRAARLAGDVSGQAWLAARNGAVTGSADVQLSGVDLATRNRDPVNATLKADLAARALQLTFSARSAAGLALDISGQAPIESRATPLRIARAAGPARFDWSLNGPIDSVWRIVGPLGVSAGGRVAGAGQLVLAAPGAKDAPLSGSGSLRLSGARLEDRASGVRLEDISAVARLSANGLIIEDMRATDGAAGKLFANGRIGAAGDGELAIDLDDLRLIRRPDVTARADGQLALAWTRQGAKLTGAIDLIDAEARQPQSTAPTPAPIAVEEINRPVAAQSAAPKPAASLPVTLDVQITGARRLFTRARGLEAEWALDARVIGTAQKPLLYGEARLLRGQATLAGRPLTFERGVVRFDGPVEAATLDMRARIDAPNLSATLALSGPLADPQLETTSTPALPQDEILPQALFGVNADQLSPLQAAQLAATLAALSGRSAFDIANLARATVNLDRLDVREDAGGLLLTGGKYITRDVYLEVSRGALGQTTSSLEWQVRPRLFVISSFLATGDPKLAIRWRREY